MKILLTGAAGSIGRVLCPGLADLGHEVVGVDLLPLPEGHTGTWFTADCADADAVHAVLAEASAETRIDAVVHCAGYPGEQGLVDSLTSHATSTAVLLDAMLEQGVTRLVYAGSNHAVGRTPRPAEGVIGLDVRMRPDTFYGVGKVAAEAVMSLYADRFGIDAISCRIGSFLPEPQTMRNLATWLSHDDCVRMVDAALSAPSPGFATMWGISANTRAWWDLAPGRALGYQPQDDAEAWAQVLAARAEDEAEAAYVGGPFTFPEHHRPAVETS